MVFFGVWFRGGARAWVLSQSVCWVCCRGGAGRPELDLLGYAPRSQRLAQLLWKRKTASLPLQAEFCSCTLLASVLQPLALAFETRARSGPSPPSGQGLLPKDFMPGRSRDLVERIDVSSRNVVQRPIELLFEA